MTVAAGEEAAAAAAPPAGRAAVDGDRISALVQVQSNQVVWGGSADDLAVDSRSHHGVSLEAASKPAYLALHPDDAIAAAAAKSPYTSNPPVACDI